MKLTKVKYLGKKHYVRTSYWKDGTAGLVLRDKNGEEVVGNVIRKDLTEILRDQPKPYSHSMYPGKVFYIKKSVLNSDRITATDKNGLPYRLYDNSTGGNGPITSGSNQEWTFNRECLTRIKKADNDSNS